MMVEVKETRVIMCLRILANKVFPHDTSTGKCSMSGEGGIGGGRERENHFKHYLQSDMKRGPDKTPSGQNPELYFFSENIYNLSHLFHIIYNLLY